MSRHRVLPESRRMACDAGVASSSTIKGKYVAGVKVEKGVITAEM
ncbi:TPA: hypothetical protein WIZ52_002074, partial [Neisseria meningitidis]